jgi:murein DD-endopeptidase MepM/ murein hydrolase activator NlpD
LAQHCNSTKSDAQPILSTVAVTSAYAVRGRHRAEPQGIDKGRAAATVAVAAGALLATGFQIGNPAVADAAPNSSDVQPQPIFPIANPFELPQLQLPQMPVEIQNGIDEINKFSDNVATQLGLRGAPGQGAVRPTGGMITSGYGARWGAMHYGVDFASPIGTPIASVSNGTVIEAGPASGFGLWVRVMQDDGTTAVYGHVNDILTTVGKRVNAGETIATVGNRGNSTGPHLHLEIWDQGGRKVDPASWLIQHGVSLGLNAADA